jgi:hypothetical protein
MFYNSSHVNVFIFIELEQQIFATPVVHFWALCELCFLKLLDFDKTADNTQTQLNTCL